jgi:hypothetical protein
MTLAESRSPTVESRSPAPQAALARTLFHAAWMAVALGVVMEVAVIVTAALAGGASPTVQAIVADGLGKVSWSAIVCTGLAIGVAASRMNPILSGFAGLLAAPLAFTAARAVHKSAAQALGHAAPAAALPLVISLSAIKAAEYTILGAVIAWIAAQVWTSAKAYLLAGAAVGVVFSLAIVLATHLLSPQPVPASRLVVTGVNELLFPIGCSMVLYAAMALGTKIAKG